VIAKISFPYGLLNHNIVSSEYDKTKVFIIIKMPKKKILATFSFTTTNKKHHSLVQQFSYLEKIVEEKNIEEIIFLSVNKTECDLKKVLELSKFKYPELIRYISLGNKLLELYQTENNWGDLGEKIVSTFYHYLIDSEVDFYIFGGIIQRGATIPSFVNYYKNNIKSSNHSSTRRKLEKIFLYHNLIEKLKLNTYHIVFDPQELDFSEGENYTKYHNYNDSRLNLHRLDSLQYYLKHKEIEKNLSLFKDLEFVFGATIIHESRMGLHSTMEELISLNERENYKVLYVNKFMKEKYNTFVERPAYLKLIQRSKYTLVLKAYEENSFSASRFIESVYYSCIPLLWHNSNYYLLESLGLSIEWLEKNLVVSNVGEIQNKIDTLDWKEISDFLYEKLFVVT
jgi:uncharacterized protein YlbG (UPF0298 family)